MQRVTASHVGFLERDPVSQHTQKPMAARPARLCLKVPLLGVRFSEYR
jgi:hypothetical protein